MTGLAIAVALSSQLFLVVGQLLLKRGMSATPVKLGSVFAGVACLSVWFFLWLGLLARWDLSRVFPFEGLNPVMVVVGAAVLLREKVSLPGWIGVTLVSIGVAIISMT